MTWKLRKNRVITLTLPLASEIQTSLIFYGGKWEKFTFATTFTSIRLVNQEDFCGATALTCFVENFLDLP